MLRCTADSVGGLHFLALQCTAEHYPLFGRLKRETCTQPETSCSLPKHKSGHSIVRAHSRPLADLLQRLGRLVCWLYTMSENTILLKLVLADSNLLFVSVED